jgi:AraC-like DNA-binding protein
MKNDSKKSDIIGTFLTSRECDGPQDMLKPGLLLREVLQAWVDECEQGSAGLQFFYPFKKEAGAEWKLFIQLRGTNTFMAPPHSMTLQTGFMGILPARDTTTETWLPDQRNRYAHFFIGVRSGRLSVNFVDGAPPRIQTAISLPFTQESLLENLMLLASGFQEVPARYCPVIADILLDGMRISKSDAPSRLIQKTIQLILDHPCNPNLSVKWMAQQVGCHADYLSRRFHQETGTSFMAYVRSKRMEIAADLLHSQKMTVADVAASCGYRDHSYFTKIFHKTYGVVPSHYS